MSNENIAIQIDVELNPNQERMKNNIAEISKALTLAGAKDKSFKVKVPVELDIAQATIANQLTDLSNRVEQVVSSNSAFKVKIPIEFSGIEVAVNKLNEEIKKYKINLISTSSGQTNSEINSVTSNIKQNAQDQQQAINNTTNAINQQRQSVESLNAAFEKSYSNYPVGGSINQTTFESLEEAKKYIEGFNVGKVTETLFVNAKREVDAFTLSLTAATGETEKFRFSWQQVNPEDESSFAYVLQNITDANAGVERLKQSTDNWNASLTASQTKFKAAADSLKSTWRDSNGNALLTNTNNVQTLDNAYNALISTINSLAGVDKATAKTIIADIQAQITHAKDLTKEFKNAEQAATELRAKNPTEVFEKYKNEVAQFKQKVTAAGIFSQITTEIAALEAALNSFSAEKSKAQLTAFLNAFDIAKSKFKSENEIKRGFDSIEASANKAISSLRGFSGLDVFRRFTNNADVQTFQANVDSLISDFQRLKETLKSGDVPRTTEGYTGLKAQLDELIERFELAKDENERLKYSLRDVNAMEGARKSAKSLTNQITEYMAANSKAAKKYAEEFQSLLSKLNTTAISGDASQVRTLTSEFESLKIRIAETGDTGQTAFQKLAAGIKSLPVVGMYLSITSLAMRATRNVKEMINNVIELDTQMTAFKRVTNETDIAYDNFLTNAGKKAVELHSSVTDLVEQTTAWVKLGNSLEDASLLAENSIMFSRVADIDNETAVKNLVSTMKAFNVEAENSIRIVDILDKLNNEFATSAKELGSGLAKTASSMAVAGNSLEKTVAILTGGTEITQNADEMATAMRTISMRIRSMKGELQDLGEEYENVQSLSKIQTQILNYTGVNIFDENENFRDTYDILLDISKVYNDLKDTAKADLTEILFGKLRANQGTAILQAFQTGQIQKAYQAAVNSAGTATAEFEKYSQSIQAHVNSYTAATQSLANSVIDDEAMKGFVDTGTKIVQFLDGFISKTGTLQTLIPIVAGSLSLFKNIGVFRTMTDDLTGATNQLGLFGKTWNQIGQDLQRGFGTRSFTGFLNKTDTIILQNYSQALRVGTVSASEFEDVLKNSSTSAQLMGKRIIELNSQVTAGTLTDRQYTAAVNSMTAAQNAATVSSKALKIALSAALNVGITILISAIVQGIMQLVNAEKEAIEKAKEAASQAQKEIEKLEELYQSYIDVEQAVKNGTKSKQDLRETTDTLIKRLGVEWSAVHDLVKEYGNLDNALKYLTAQEIIENLLPDLKAGVQAAGKELVAGGKRIGFDLVGGGKNQNVFAYGGLKSWFDEWNKQNGNVLSISEGFLNEVFSVATTGGERDLANGIFSQSAIKELENEISVLSKLQSDLLKDGKDTEEVYSRVHNRLNNLKSLYEAYTSAVEKNNQQAAKAIVAQKALNTELPKTFDEYVKYREQMLNTAKSDDFINLFAGTAQDIENAIVDELSSSSMLSAFEKQLDNLNELSYKYIGRAFSEGAASSYEAQIRNFLSNLSAEDLEIATQIPDLFENGLDGASEKIAKWKGDPNNQLLDEETVESLSDKIDKATKKVKVITSAMSDMNDTGHISSSTYKDILEQGENFTNSLEVQNGMLTLNVEKLKELETQEIKNTIAANNLEIAELQLEAARRAQAQGDWQSISQMISDLERENEVFSLLKEEIATASPKTSSGGGSTGTEDTLKAGFEKDMKEVEHLYNMGLKTAEEYYDALEAANEEWYAKSAEHESDYLSNIEKIYKGRQQILKENADKELEILDNQLKLGYIKQEEYDKSLVELAEKYYGKSSTYYGTDFAADNYKTVINKATDNDQSQYKESFEKQLKELDKALDKGAVSVEKYREEYAKLRDEWWGEGSQWGGTTFASDMFKEMTEALENVDDLYSEISAQYQKLNDNTRKGNADYIKSMISLNDDLYKLNDPKKWKDNYADIADEAKEFYKNLLNNGTLDAEQYRDKINVFFNRLKGLGVDLGQSWLASALDIDDIEYSALKKKLSDDGGKTLKDVEQAAERLSRKNIRLFADDPNTLKENAEDIFGAVKDAAKDELDKLLITPEKYLEVIEEWGKKLDVAESVIDEARKALSESDYLDAWELQNNYGANESKNDFDLRAKRAEYLRELAEKLYGKEGQDDVKAYTELVKQANEEEKAILEDRLSAEKSYWERRKSEVEKAYDKEIEKLEKAKTEADKLNKATELRTNLLKAQQKVEDAKKQRNQLIFENGTFRYDYNQENVLSAEEEVANAVKAIQENQLSEQINLIKEQKDNATKFYDDIIGQIEAYTDSIEPLAESNNELLSEILNSLPAQNEREVDEYVLEESDSEAVTADKGKANDAISGKAKLSNSALKALQAMDLFKALGVAQSAVETSVSSFRSAFAASTPLEIAKTFSKMVEASDRADTIQSISDTATSVITIGDISINVQGDTSEKMLLEFAEQLGEAVEAKINEITYSNN